MPNRLIKDSIHTSDTVNAMTDFQFRIWVNLITYVDDFGRGDARPAVIKGMCFPLLEAVTPENVGCTLLELERMDCIHLYRVGGKPYLCFPKWSDHQTIRNQKSKYPAPEEADVDDGDLQADEINCEQLKSTASKCPRNPIQSNPNPNPNPNPNEENNSGGSDIENPYGESDPNHRPDFNTLEVYATNNLRGMTPYNVEQLATYRDDLPEEVIRHAIDEACGSGHPYYNYTRAILNRYVEEGFKSLSEVLAFEAERRKRKGGNAQGSTYADEDDFY